ncbi:MAG: alpha/beta hydrolase [Proteobacteria bacterium]|nr:alpha/beta hydrolase [Pseudomonadota bacterium]
MTVQTLLKNDEPHLKVRATAPEWFDWAIGQPCESRTVAVECCDIHYLRWRSPVGRAPKRGILFIHGGGAHANWWRFVAPFFAEDYRVAAIDLSGMGDSGRREKYTSSQRAREIREVLSDADLGEQPFIVGHSFGGFMTVQFGVDYGDQIAGAIIADTPIRRPDDPPPGRAQRIFNYTRTYPTFEEAVARFRLMPAQTCDNNFLVEFIARHSLKAEGDGWNWKFDPHAMGADRWKEPFHEHTQNMRCRRAYIRGELSALVSREGADYISGLMGPDAPIIEIPRAHHHIMLDQPLAFVSAVRALLETWQRSA